MSNASQRVVDSRPVLVIHGGAGTFDRASSTPERRKLYNGALRAALFAGNAVLNQGGSALDAAVAAVTSMEDCPLFNCARGAVFNVAGKNELEASVMVSRPPGPRSPLPPARRGFAVTLLTRTKNPSQLARALYTAPDAAPHVFLSGANAESIGSERLGVALVDPAYFWTEARWREHRRGLGLPEDPPDAPPAYSDAGETPPLDMLPKGTVGAVALDAAGVVASVTSTGGRTNKLVGRIGDTPSMGSGFWAEEWEVREKGLLARVKKLLGVRPKTKVRAVGVSGTGDGDYFIRRATAATLCSRMKLLNESVGEAAKHVVEELRVDGGDGGIIALDDQGHVTFALNTNGMYRGYIKAHEGVPYTAIFDDDPLE